MESFAYCKSKINASHSDWHYSLLFAESEQRPRITVLLALLYELQDLAATTTDQPIAEVRLNWWRQEIDKAFTTSSQHPVADALAHIKCSSGIRKEFLHAMIDAAEIEVKQPVFSAFDDLLHYCGQARGAFSCLLGGLSAGPDQTVD
ncbi:MAG: squalene/phytoene synthase family protein, partial [Gammaproteobacteria bacterium]|nr:squalene/phytoene synthase family protein [Gammaproteobacteria bacterium]